MTKPEIGDRVQIAKSISSPGVIYRQIGEQGIVIAEDKDRIFSEIDNPSFLIGFSTPDATIDSTVPSESAYVMWYLSDQITILNKEAPKISAFVDSKQRLEHVTNHPQQVVHQVANAISTLDSLILLKNSGITESIDPALNKIRELLCQAIGIRP